MVVTALARARMAHVLHNTPHLSRRATTQSTHLPPWTHCRSSLSARFSSTNSFWSQSYPPSRPESSPNVPSVPFISHPPRPQVGNVSNVPIIPHVTSAIAERAEAEANETGREPGSRKRERKQRYLDSLMDKAGELSLKCESSRTNNQGCSLTARLHPGLGRKLDSRGGEIQEV
jgi:hypothetical protein